ncbi:MULTISPECIES: endonuclease/exonuclease/phosphatase family protein [unclassified Spirillospora]|uniref:endonuclease/exonuclease/phosphatase family protein n=1 Tax=unclassified Spirillospora TaxID=2642701 RepID=UPI00371279D7
MKARVLTFNTLFRGRSRARLGVLAQIMERSDYDVVCLQEVISPRNLVHLRSAAKSYPYTAHASTFPVVRGGLITLSRRPITRLHFQPFTPTRPARPEWLLRKGALFTRVQLPGGFLTVVNTHLSANMDMHWAPSNAYTKAEESELRELAALIGRIDPAEPMVVMGDFNVPRDYPLFKDFASATGLQDALAGDTQPTYRPEYADLKPIDQILVRPGMEAAPRLVFKEKIRLPGGHTTALSDHYGIEATLTVRRPPP